MNLIEIKDNKKFMKALLIDNVFDTFFLEEADITTYNHLYIDGHIVQEFYQQDNSDLIKRDLMNATDHKKPDDFSTWEQIRPLCFQFIRGKRLPVQFKIVLHASKDITQKLLLNHECTISPEALKSLVLTIRYNGNTTQCVSATALHTFVPDKSIDSLWDKWIIEFISQSGLS